MTVKMMQQQMGQPSLQGILNRQNGKKNFMKSISPRMLSGSIVALAIFLSSSVNAYAETTDFGGYPERFKGAGDKIPPECQIDLPKSTVNPFFIKWNCTDDNAESQDIRTELWMYKKGATSGQLLSSFLGFPAATQIDAGILNAASVKDGLPASFRLVAIDRAGITTISPILTVTAQDNSVDTCDLTITRSATQSSGSTTGIPELTVKTVDTAVKVGQPSTTELTVSSGTITAQPCEIDSLCFNGQRISFSASVAFSKKAGDNSVKGKVSVIPGSLVIDVSGTSTVDGVVLKSLSLSGSGTIDGIDATLSLDCNQ